MREEFLHYVWQYQIWQTAKLYTTIGELVQIQHPGSVNTDAGPDFFTAQIMLGEQRWAGNIEIHIRSSDWYAHNHHRDKRYNSVILHVVWEHDVEVFREDETVIAVLEIKDYVSKDLLTAYTKLQDKPVAWIACQDQLASVPKFITDAWLERVYLERLERKATELLQDAEQNKYHWEALLFSKLAKNFGLKVNGESFYQMAVSIPFHVVQKCQNNLLQLEALFMGQAGLLEETKEDTYFQQLQQEYAFLRSKFSLQPIETPPKFFRLRPYNFPTIRLSQLANLYHANTALFSNWIKSNEVNAFYTAYRVKASEYWNAHYNFGVPSTKRNKRLSKSFIDLLLINTLVPIRFVYGKYLGQNNAEEIMEVIEQLSPENNSIITNYKKYGLKGENALQSQGLLQLYNNYCTPKRCLSCAIGNAILKQSVP